MIIVQLVMAYGTLYIECILAFDKIAETDKQICLINFECYLI